MVKVKEIRKTKCDIPQTTVINLIGIIFFLGYLIIFIGNSIKFPDEVLLNSLEKVLLFRKASSKGQLKFKS
ncbi:MAG TPA: hypothetical protein DCX54_08370 [Flavobacteriales bacterium]|nr:hypothetical protein [Flavobacteriales bacterium]